VSHDLTVWESGTSRHDAGVHWMLLELGLELRVPSIQVADR